MEKQSNSDLEQTSAEETLTSLVGQSQSLATPSLNLVFEDPTVELYLANVGDGTLTLHTIVKAPLTPGIMKHYLKIFTYLICGLEDRGLDHLDTWIEPNDKNQKTFAEYFGFKDTGFLKNIEFSDGSEQLYEEMRYTFPKIRNSV